MAETTRLTPGATTKETSRQGEERGRDQGPCAVLFELPEESEEQEEDSKEPPSSPPPQSPGAIGVSKQVVAKKPSVQIREPARISRQVSSGMYSGGYSVVKVEEKHGPLHNAIPVMPLPLAIICCILNILVPGIGTLIAAPTVFCCGSTRIKRPLVAFGLNLLSSLGQMLTFLVIVGWIWSILWGMTFVTMSWDNRKARPSQV